MSDRRRTQQQHIRAARDWLGQAEHSLERENDVQGDLKVMLARAELSHVQDSPRGRRLKYWGSRIFPAAAAVLLAAGVWTVWHMPEPVRPEATVSTAPLPAKPSAAPEPIQQPAPDSVSLPSVQEKEAEPAPVFPQRSSEGAGAAAVHPRPVPADEGRAAPAGRAGTVPSAETQKLMQSAGKVLRQ